MARAYTIATVALTLDTTVKWLDNVLSHHVVPGVTKQRQGIPRRLNVETVLVLELALVLIRDLGVVADHAINLAGALVKAGGELQTRLGLTMTLDLVGIRT